MIEGTGLTGKGRSLLCSLLQGVGGDLGGLIGVVQNMLPRRLRKDPNPETSGKDLRGLVLPLSTQERLPFGCIRRAALGLAVTTDVTPPKGRTILLYAILLLCGGGPVASPAQSILGGGAAISDAQPQAPTLQQFWLLPPWAERDPERPQRVVPRDRAPLSSTPSDDPSQDAHFRRALEGSTLGVAVGTGLGALLLTAAEEEGVGDDECDRLRDDPPDTGSLLFAAGLFAVAAGGPIGAVAGAGIEERRAEAYVVATFGELLLGGIGYGLASQLHDSLPVQLVGLGLGTAFGAAGGTALVASETTRGVAAHRNGSWHVAPPEVRVRPACASGQSPSIRVTLVSVRL